jgi:DNA-binding NarL/FixJ family response regulator
MDKHMRFRQESQPAMNGKSQTNKKAATPVVNRLRSRIMVADDHPAFRTSLIQVLHKIEELDVIACAEDGYQAVELTTQLHPDLILMDVNMPRMNGIEATSRIIKLFPDMQIIGLSMDSEDSIVSEQMRAAGAIGYYPKYGPVERLLTVIQYQLNLKLNNNSRRA